MRLFGKIVLLLLAATCELNAHAQFTINDMPVVYDVTTSTFICSVYKSIYGTNLDAIVEMDITYDKIFIDGTVICDGDSATAANHEMTFAGIEGGKMYPMLLIAGTDTTEAALTFTCLPIVILEGDFSKEYSPAAFTLIHPSSTIFDIEAMTAKAKWRGSTTNTADRHKRNYHIRFLDEAGNKQDRRLFDDLRKDDSWILDAGQVDMSRIRNAAGMSLWNSFVRPPYYGDTEPDALAGTRSHMVEVMLGNEYRGVYTLSEAIDRKQLKLKKYEEDTKVIHGLLWKTLGWSKMTYMSEITSDYNPRRDKWDYYELKYPDLDDVKPTDWTPMYDGINFVATSSNADFIAHVDQVFDLDRIADFHILYQVILSIDNVGKNLYWACYDAQQSHQLTLTPWDLDTSVGQSNPQNPMSAVSPERDFATSHRLYRRLIALNPDHYYDLVKRRYHALRSTLLSEDSVIAHYTRLLDLMIESGAAAREQRKWSGDSDIEGKTLDIAAEREYIVDWLKRRLHFLDENTFAYTPFYGDVNDDTAIDVVDMNIIINIILGHLTLDDYPLADVNGDSEVNSADLNILINLILEIPIQ